MSQETPLRRVTRGQHWCEFGQGSEWQTETLSCFIAGWREGARVSEFIARFPLCHTGTPAAELWEQLTCHHRKQVASGTWGPSLYPRPPRCPSRSRHSLWGTWTRVMGGRCRRDADGEPCVPCLPLAHRTCGLGSESLLTWFRHPQKLAN